MTLIKKPKLSDAVIEVIKEKIITGELKKGDKLPNQNEFARQLGVSRTVLREALESLTRLGVLEQRPKTGTVIKSDYPAVQMETQPLRFAADRRAKFEMIETRLLIEEGGAKLAAQNATEEQIAELGKLVDKMAQLLSEVNLHEYAKSEVEFHTLIIQATQNRITMHLYKSIRDITERFFLEIYKSLYAVFLFHDTSMYFHECHEKIYQAIKNREPEKASEEMKKHILITYEALKQYYNQIDKIKKQTKK